MGEHGLRPGSAHVRSAGPITFEPGGILFLADNVAATIYAIDVGDPAVGVAAVPLDVEGVDVRVAAYLGCPVEDVTIRDIAVHPTSHNVYLSVQRGRGDAGQAVLVRIDHLDASVSDVPLDAVPMASVTIADAPSEDDGRLDSSLPTNGEGEELKLGDGRTIRILRQPIRTSTVTDMAYVDGALLVAGLSNEEFSSKLRRIPFPFGGEVTGVNLEIFHVSHGKWETAAPIRAFAPYEDGRSILATYTCTPVVHFPLGATPLPGTKVVGRTVAELGSVNQPLDVVTFRQEGEEYLLVANSAHGLVKIACRDIDQQAPLTEPKEPVGVPRETEDLQGIVRLDNLDDGHVLALQTNGEGRQHLRSLKTASL